MLNSIKNSYPQARDLLAKGGYFALTGARCAASASGFEFAGRVARKSPLLGSALLTGAIALSVIPKSDAGGITAAITYPIAMLGAQRLNKRMAAQDAAKAPKGTMHNIKQAANNVLKTARKYPVPAAFAAGLATISAYNMTQSDDGKKK